MFGNHSLDTHRQGITPLSRLSYSRSAVSADTRTHRVRRPLSPKDGSARRRRLSEPAKVRIPYGGLRQNQLASPTSVTTAFAKWQRSVCIARLSTTDALGRNLVLLDSVTKGVALGQIAPIEPDKHVSMHPALPTEANEDGESSPLERLVAPFTGRLHVIRKRITFVTTDR